MLAPILFFFFECSLVLSSVEASHHGDELLELNLTVSVFVNLFDDGVNGLDAQGVGAAETEDFTDLFCRDDAGVVLVEHFEGGVQLLMRGQVRLACSSNDELGVVDEAAVVCVDGAEHLLDFLVGHDAAVVLQVADLNLLHGKLSIAIGVERLEDLGQVIALGLAHKLGSDECIGSLLEGNVGVEFTQVVKSVHG